MIEAEVNKLLEVGYIVEIQFTKWLSYMVVVPKGLDKWMMCTDYTDLNKVYPKDPYPLPRIHILVDSIVGYAMLSMMDVYQGYYQIFITEKDMDKTTFITNKCVYYYREMLFWLKNVGSDIPKAYQKNI